MVTVLRSKCACYFQYWSSVEGKGHSSKAEKCNKEGSQEVRQLNDEWWKELKILFVFRILLDLGLALSLASCDSF